MDPAPATTTGSGGRLLACSPDRTLVATTDPRTGAAEVRKLFERGSLADAEREVAVGRWLAGLDVVAATAAELDPVTSRPCVRMPLVEGRDLGRLVAEGGALPAALVCRIGAQLATTLAAMHALRRPELPRGLCHGDVKPANVLWTGERAVLLDLEQAAAIGDGAPGRGWQGGTDGFRAPEAAALAAPTAAFDIFALGRTLRWLLDGGERRPQPRLLAAHEPRLAQLLASCTADEADARPEAAALAASLATLADELAASASEAVLAALQRGDDARLDAVAGPRREALQALAQRLQRLRRRLPPLATDLADEPGPLLAALRQVGARLRRWPCQPELLARRAELLKAAGELLGEAMQRHRQRCRDEAFAEAATFLADLRQLAAAALELPGRLPIPFAGDPRMPPLAVRQPLQFLASLQRDLEQRQEDHAELEAAVDAAEAALDLATAERAIDRMAAQTGGTTAAQSRRRDRLHRLGFWLERLQRARRSIERLGELLPDGQPALRRLLDDCGGSNGNGNGHAAMGLRSLQLTLLNLGDEFPQLQPRLQPCRDELTAALARTSEQAWQLLDRAHGMLRAVPVPVRPLQTLLHRLDNLRLLEAVIDLPERARSQWHDRVEALRLELEQARATRDRLAQGAELAIARGHWTTGLFDMERAVTAVDDGDDDTEATRQLHERLLEARRKKRELEAAVQRNMQLASRFADLLDAPDADYGERLRVLRERRDCLQYLVLQVPGERGELYASDLREVETLLVLEQAAEAEAQLDHTALPAERLRLSRATLAQLSQPTSTTDVGAELPGRIARLQEHWRHLASSAQREVEQERQQAKDRLRRRRRRQLAAAGAGVMLFAFLGLGYQVMANNRAGSELVLWQPTQRPVAEIASDRAAAVRELRSFTTGLPEALQPPARALVDAVDAPPAAADLGPWQQTLQQRVQDWAVAAGAAGLVTDQLAACQRFGAAAWRTGLVLAALQSGDAAAIEAMTRSAAAAAEGLSAHGIDLPIDIGTQLRSLARQ